MNFTINSDSNMPDVPTEPCYSRFGDYAEHLEPLNMDFILIDVNGIHYGIL